MRDTSPLEKFIPSLINAVTAVILSLPFYYWFGLGLEWKLSAIIIFYLMQIIDTHRHSHFRCLGMRIFGTHWAKKYSEVQKDTYSILYTLSFSTLFFHVFFPFDLFLANMLLLQLPTVLITHTTLHGFLAGGLRTQINVHKR